jgi:hypothetical protein
MIVALQIPPHLGVRHRQRTYGVPLDRAAAFVYTINRASSVRAHVDAALYAPPALRKGAKRNHRVGCCRGRPLVDDEAMSAAMTGLQGIYYGGAMSFGMLRSCREGAE